MKKLSGIILVGGKSTRFKRDKAFLKIGPYTFLERIINKLKPLCAEIIVSTKRPDQRLKRVKAVRIIKDALPTKGSLVGIYSGLKTARYKHALVVACDMPLINPRLLRYLMRYLFRYDVVIPASPKGMEPLCAIYSKKCLKPMARQMRKGDFKITNFSPEIKVKVVKLSQLKWPKTHRQARLTARQAGLININTPEDYREIKEAPN